MTQRKSMPQNETPKFVQVIYTSSIQHKDPADYPFEDWIGDATLRDESSFYQKYIRVKSIEIQKRNVFSDT